MRLPANPTNVRGVWETLLGDERRAPAAAGLLAAEESWHTNPHSKDDMFLKRISAQIKVLPFGLNFA
jgi:hypothetical protein